MKFKTISTGSKGNSYILENNNGEKLLIELGMPRKEIIKALDYDITSVAGAIISHCHSDHSLSCKDFELMGIKIFKPYEESRRKVKYGDFEIHTFDLPHDGTDNFGFYIKADGQKVLYLTDFEYCKYVFKDLNVNHILVECNYQEEYLDTDAENFGHKVLGHASFDTCKNFVLSNQTDALQNVYLLHYSDFTCDIRKCVIELKNALKSHVMVGSATKGQTVELKENC